MSLNELLLKKKNPLSDTARKMRTFEQMPKDLKGAQIYVNWPLSIASLFVSLWQIGLRPVDLEPIWDTSTHLLHVQSVGTGTSLALGGKMPLLNMTSKSKGKPSAFNPLL